MRRPILSIVAPLALLGACASTPEIAPSQQVETNSAYGLYLAGQGALNDGRTDEATRYFDRARTAVGDPAVLGERAFVAALLSGEVTRAASIAPRGEGASEQMARLGRLVSAVEALAQGRAREAQAALAEPIGFPHAGAAALLRPWAAAQAGDVESSLVKPDAGGERLVEVFGQLGQALLYERAGRYDEAETDFKALTAGQAPPEMMVLAYGAFLERRGRGRAAVEMYDAALARQSGGAALSAARARAAAGKAAPPAPTPRQGAAQALLAPAATLLAIRQDQVGLAYLRLALRLDPKRDDAWLMVGDLLAAAGEMEGARAAYERPPADSPEYAAARSKLAWSYQNDDQPQAALKMARQAAAGGDADARLTLADLLRANEQYGEAAELLSGLIGEAKSPDWRLLYARGVAYERQGDWPKAERDLSAALALRPEEPELLNYLGYSWIDRGERLHEAMAMVEKAVAANPRSGAMVDSLGWAHYRLGNYAKAVELLERAVELEAGDPDINNHLGDAYWRVGRRDEAMFQWRRVLTLDPPEKIKAEAEAKLKNGPEPVRPAGAPPKVAGR